MISKSPGGHLVSQAPVELTLLYISHLMDVLAYNRFSNPKPPTGRVAEWYILSARPPVASGPKFESC